MAVRHPGTEWDSEDFGEGFECQLKEVKSSGGVNRGVDPVLRRKGDLGLTRIAESLSELVFPVFERAGRRCCSEEGRGSLPTAPTSELGDSLFLCRR